MCIILFQFSLLKTIDFVMLLFLVLDNTLVDRDNRNILVDMDRWNLLYLQNWGIFGPFKKKVCVSRITQLRLADMFTFLKLNNIFLGPHRLIYLLSPCNNSFKNISQYYTKHIEICNKKLHNIIACFVVRNNIRIIKLIRCLPENRI